MLLINFVLVPHSSAILLMLIGTEYSASGDMLVLDIKHLSTQSFNLGVIIIKSLLFPAPKLTKNLHAATPEPAGALNQHHHQISSK